MARERETRGGRGSACPEGPRKSFQLAFCECSLRRRRSKPSTNGLDECVGRLQRRLCECGYFQLVGRLPRGKVTALGEKTHSINHQLLKHGLCCRWNAYHQNLDRIDEMKDLPGA